MQESRTASTIEVSAWRSGRFDGNSTYGISSSALRSLLKGVKELAIVCSETGKTVHCHITEGFWNKCPEIRNRYFREYFEGLGVAPWPKGKPPRFLFTRQADGSFLLRKK